MNHADILGKSVLSEGISKHTANAKPVSGTKQACSKTSNKDKAARVGHVTKQEYCIVQAWWRDGLHRSLSA